MADLAVALLSKAYGAVEGFAKRGLHPEEFLTFEFLRDHPILLQPGMLRVDWNRIPGLTRRIVTLPTIVVPDHLWGRWERQTGETAGNRMRSRDISSGTWPW